MRPRVCQVQPPEIKQHQRCVFVRFRSTNHLLIPVRRRRYEAPFPLQVSGLPISRFESPYQSSHKTKQQRGAQRSGLLFRKRFFLMGILDEKSQRLRSSSYANTCLNQFSRVRSGHVEAEAHSLAYEICLLGERSLLRAMVFYNATPSKGRS